MKNIIFILSLALLAVGCVLPSEHTKETQVFFLDKKMKTFEYNHPDWRLNSVKNEAINKVFIDSVKVWMQDAAFLNGINFTLDKIVRFDGEKSYTAIFKSTGYNNLNIFGLIKDTDIDSLKEGAIYRIKGKFLKYSPPTALSGVSINIDDKCSFGDFTVKITSYEKQNEE